MKYLINILLVTFVLCNQSLWAEEVKKPPKGSDANIIGDVKNAKTGEHMPYINISVKNTVLGTSTDATGHYFLKNLPTGKIVLKASALGYKTVEKETEINPNETLEINFILEGVARTQRGGCQLQPQRDEPQRSSCGGGDYQSQTF